MPSRIILEEDMPALPTRKIGNDDVAEMGLGLMGMSAFYGQTEGDEERFKFLDAALEEGATFWDTANGYGDSEELVGKWFKRTGNRDKIFFATKCGIVYDNSTGTVNANGTPEHIRSCCEESLRRLGVNQIDLFYLHRADPTVPIEKTVGAMAELVKEGKVRYLGLSEISSATLRRAHAVHPISAVQVEYSPFFLDIENEKIGLLKTCRELGVTVVAYSPLGRGLLTGRYKSSDDFEEGDLRRIFPKFSKDNFPTVLRLSDSLAEIGKRYNATAGQTTLAWLLAQGKDIIPIPGTKNIKYLKENNASVNIKLDTEDIAHIRKLAEKTEADFGDVTRYPVSMMPTLFTDTVPL